MIGIESGVIDVGSEFGDGGHVAADPCYCLILCYADLGMSLENILHYIRSLRYLRGIDEGDLVAFQRKGDALAAGVRPVAGDGDRLLGDGLPFVIVRVGDRLVGGEGHTVFVHVVYGVAQGVARPVRVDGRVLGDLHLPVEELGIVFSRVEPAVEGVAGFCGISGFRDLLIFLNGLALGLRRSAVRDKVDRIGRRRPFGVEHQVGRWHLVEGILRRQAGIGIPAGKAEVRINAALCSRRRPDIGALVDVGVELDIFDRIEQVAAVIVVDIESVTIVIEVVLCDSLCTGIAVIVGVTGNFLRTEVTTAGGIGLTVRFRPGVTVVVRILQPVIDGICIGIGCPLRCIGYGLAVIGQHIFCHEQTFCYVSCLLLGIIPTVEAHIGPTVVSSISAGHVSGPGSRNVLPQFYRHGIAEHSGPGNAFAGERSFDIVVRVVVIVRSGIELEGEFVQFIIHKQYRGAVRFDDDAGGGVLSVVFYPAPPRLVRYAVVITVYRSTYRAGTGCGSVVHKGGFGAGVVVFLKEIYDRIVDRFARPLSIYRRIAIEDHGGTRRLLQCFVQIPAREGVARTGRNRGGQRNIGTIGSGSTADIGAAVGLIGKGVGLAGVLDLKFLPARLGDRGALGAFEDGVFVVAHGGRHEASQHAVHVTLSVDLGVAVAGQILEKVDEVIDRSVRYVLNAHGLRLVFAEIAQRDRDALLRGEVDRMTGHVVFLGLRGDGRNDGMGKFVLF